MEDLILDSNIENSLKKHIPCSKSNFTLKIEYSQIKENTFPPTEKRR